MRLTDGEETQERWIEEALARGRHPSSPEQITRVLDALGHLDLDALHEYNLRRLRESPGASSAIINRPFVRHDRPRNIAKPLDKSGR